MSDMMREVEDYFRKELEALCGVTTPPPPTVLTREKLLQAMEAVRNIQALYPRPDAFDLYGHDLPDLEQSFIIDKARLHQGLFAGGSKHYPWMDPLKRLFDPGENARKVLIVPRVRLEEIYFALRSRGIDVRLEPRYGAVPNPNEEPPPCP